MHLQELIPGLLIGAGEAPGRELWEMGIRRILQLQWDHPQGPQGPQGQGPEGEAEEVEVEATFEKTSISDG